MVKVALKSVRKRTSRAKIILWSLVGLALMIFIIGIVSESSTKQSYLKELRVCKAIVENRELDDEDAANIKYYIRVRLSDNAPSDYISQDNLTIQVKPEFYSMHDLNSSIGVSIGNYDVFHKKAFGRGQVFEKNEWVLEEVYESFEAAKEANPVKKTVAKALVTKKKITKDGRLFFAIKTEDRTMPAEVSKQVFDRYSENQEVNCEFDVMGDSMKFSKVVE